MKPACNTVDRTGPGPAPRSGREPDPMDLALARLSHDVYETTGSSLDGWDPVSSARLEASGIAPERSSDPETGFHARIYQHREHGFALVLRGTDEARDWVSNLRQGVGLGDLQYRQAVSLAISARSAFGDELVIVGHSLGGGLASIASLRTGVPAVTFNAAGVHDRTLDHYGITRDARHRAAETGQVRRYTVDNEILTSLQEHALQTRGILPDAIGHRIRLSDPEPLSIFDRLATHRRLSHALETHSMDSVLRALEAPPRPEGRSQAATALIARSIQAIHQLDDLRRNSNVPGLGLVNVAVFVAARARESGMDRIDHMACSEDGTRLFAIQGPRGDPAQHRVGADVRAAACIIELAFLNGRSKLAVPFYSVVSYDS